MKVAVFACSLLVLSSGAFAQTEPAPSNAPATETVDAAKLGVSIGRIRLQLQQPKAKEGIRIQETIEVIGIAPKLRLWDPETAKLATGPVPYGAPTQKDILNLITPQEFKSYPFDLNAVLQWLLEHMNDKGSERKEPE